MHPSLVGIDVALGPDMVGPVEDEPGLVIKRDAHRSEAVSPLTAAAVSRLEQLQNTVVPRKPQHRCA